MPFGRYSIRACSSYLPQAYSRPSKDLSTAYRTISLLTFTVSAFSTIFVFRPSCRRCPRCRRLSRSLRGSGRLICSFVFAFEVSRLGCGGWSGVDRLIRRTVWNVACTFSHLYSGLYFNQKDLLELETPHRVLVSSVSSYDERSGHCRGWWPEAANSSNQHLPVRISSTGLRYCTTA